MSTPTIDDDPALTALLDADPGSGVSMPEDAGARIVHAAVVASKPRAKRRLAVAGGVCAALLTIGVPAGAVASGYLAQTGWFGSPNPGNPEGTETISTESDDSEWIDFGAADYVEFAASLWPEYADLPPGYQTDEFAAAIAQRSVEATGWEPGLRQITSIVAEFEQSARCAWRAEWLAADAAGDPARQKTAVDVLRDAASWPATVATDGGGIVDGELDVADAAAAGDRAGVEELNSWCDRMLEAVGR